MAPDPYDVNYVYTRRTQGYNGCYLTPHIRQHMYRAGSGVNKCTGNHTSRTCGGGRHLHIAQEALKPCLCSFCDQEPGRG